jgi:putative ABC transport system permease protein
MPVSFNEGMKMALISLTANKLRSALTMLGLIIGVSAVITLVTLGQGAGNMITAQVEGLGSNLLSVSVLGRGAATTVAYDEAMIFAELEGVQRVAPTLSQNGSVKYRNKSVNVQVVGTNAEYFDVKNYDLAGGRFISNLDVMTNQKIAMLGFATAADIFGQTDPVGKYITIQGSRHKVVGTLAEKGSSIMGSNDEIVLIPVTTAERLFQVKGVRSVEVQLMDGADSDSVIQALSDKLTRIFRGESDSFTILNQEDLLSTVGTITTTLSAALGGIAGISLLVSGIGIMNIMLVSVTERTKEIGIRKAIGAKRRDILFQFLIESSVLSGIGGLLGIIVGVGLSQAVAVLANLEVAVSIPIVGLAFGFSVAMGIVFGIFPANKAAKLRPIEALRSE